MARIAKPGLEYFPFDVDLFQDFRIRKLIKRQGGKAVTVYALLLCLIYKNGYFLQWDEELPFICSESTGFDEAYILEVVKACLALGLFDKNLYASHKVLTSRSIQVRYCNIQRLNKRTIKQIDRYSLLDEAQLAALSSKKGKDKEPQPDDRPEEPAQEQPPQPRPDTPQLPAPKPPGKNDQNQWLSIFFADSNSENLQMLCKSFGLGPSQFNKLRSLAQAVVAEWELSHTVHWNYSDWSRHLISTMRKKNRDNSLNPSLNTAENSPQDYSFGGGFGGQDT